MAEARTLDQVISSLGSIYDPQVQQVQTQRDSLPGQLQAQTQGLQAKQDAAFGNILDGARSRGLGFSGIPLAEQAKYTATDYLPALANLQTANTQAQSSLQDAINQINERRATQGQSIFENERNFYEQQREFNVQQAAAADAARRAASGSSYASPSLGGGGGLDLSALLGGNPGSASAVQRKDGGFNYVNSAGQPISAAAYAAAKGLAFRDVLNQAAKAGDKGAKAALGFVGNDYGYDPRKITNKSMADLYNALVWGTGKSASYKPAVIQKKQATYKPPTKVLNINNPLALKARA